MRLAPVLALPLVSALVGAWSTGCSKKSGDAAAPVRVTAPAADALLAPGDQAPGFEGETHTGEVIDLESLRGQVVVLYFYPKDGTPGCTEEAQGFRDNYDAIQSADATVIGVSMDDNESHRAFADEHGLPFFLLPDTEGAIAEVYGVGRFMGFSNRVTFVIARTGRIAKVFDDVDPATHADQILTEVRSL